MDQRKRKSKIPADVLLRIDAALLELQREESTLDRLAHEPLTRPQSEPSRARPVTIFDTLDDDRPACAPGCCRCWRNRWIARNRMRLGKLQRKWMRPAAVDHVVGVKRLRDAHAARRRFTDAEYDAAKSHAKTQKALAAALNISRQGLVKYEEKRFGKKQKR